MLRRDRHRTHCRPIPGHEDGVGERHPHGGAADGALISLRYELREPSERFPEGYARAISVAFLVTACVLTIIGLYLLYDSA
jgi:hypothetical protein